MGIFKNEVGRPSNETKKKRKVLYVGLIMIAIIIICVIFFINKVEKKESNKIIKKLQSDYKYIGDDGLQNVNPELIGSKVVAITDIYDDYSNDGYSNKFNIKILNNEEKLVNIVSLENVYTENDLIIDKLEIIGVYDSKLYIAVLYSKDLDANYYLDIYAIDLTKGNENYEIELIKENLNINFQDNSFNNIIGLYNGIIFTESRTDKDDNAILENGEIYGYDMEKDKIVLKLNFYDDAYLDKYNKCIYYKKSENDIYKYNFENQIEEKLVSDNKYSIDIISYNYGNFIVRKTEEEDNYYFYNFSNYKKSIIKYNGENCEIINSKNYLCYDENNLILKDKIIKEDIENLEGISPLYGNKVLLLRSNEENKNSNYYSIYDLDNNEFINSDLFNINNIDYDYYILE